MTVWILVIMIYVPSGGSIAVDHISGFTSEQTCQRAATKMAQFDKHMKATCIEAK